MMTLTHFFKVLLMLGALQLGGLAHAWNSPAFEAESAQQVALLLNANLAKLSPDIHIIAADRAENGAVVQVEMRSDIPNTQSVYLVVEHNPNPFITQFDFENGSSAHVITRIKMAKSSTLKVIVKANNQFYYATKEVVVLEDGCSGTDSNDAFISSIKMRAKQILSATEVKAIIVHPMITGRGKNTAGELVPAHFIQTIEVFLNGNPVLHMQASTAISKNPYLTFYLNNAKVGDKIDLKWADNKGQTGSGNTLVLAE
jgi:thiosulfate oxidation carrier complex protein SoxZ